MLRRRSSCSRPFAVPAVASLYASHASFSTSLYPFISQHLSASVLPEMTSKLNQNDIKLGSTVRYAIKNPGAVAGFRPHNQRKFKHVKLYNRLLSKGFISHSSEYFLLFARLSLCSFQNSGHAINLSTTPSKL